MNRRDALCLSLGFGQLFLGGVANACKEGGRYVIPKVMGEPTILNLCSHPILRDAIYKYWPGGQYDSNGAGGRNAVRMELIENQRACGEYVIAGLLSGKEEWCDIGWRVANWGLSQQNNDGSFSGRYASLGGQYHSSTIFLNALEMACMAQPEMVRDYHLDGIYKSAKWMEINRHEAMRENAAYTHRFFLSMSVIGRAEFLTGCHDLNVAVNEWAEKGLLAQKKNGVNPELGGFDISYQMAGPFFSLLYIPVCANYKLKMQLKEMCKRAIDWWCQRQKPDGSVDIYGSTRIGVENNLEATALKKTDYNQAVRALVWAGIELNQPSFFRAASAAVFHLR